MDQTPPIPQPLLIVVAGRPGAGKTTLAHSLARAVRCPAICRDEFKEGLVNTTGEIGTPGDAIVWKVYEVFFDTVTFLLSHRITLVAEAAFLACPAFLQPDCSQISRTSTRKAGTSFAG
jgi:predicted kinase